MGWAEKTNPKSTWYRKRHPYAEKQEPIIGTRKKLSIREKIVKFIINLAQFVYYFGKGKKK